MASHRYLTLLLASLLRAYDPATAVAPPNKEVVTANPQRLVIFGDLHVHTSLATDAFSIAVRALPEDT